MASQVQWVSPDLPRRGYAMVLMVVSSVIISFGGILVRSLEMADPWHVNLYRSVAFIPAIFITLMVQSRGRAFQQTVAIGGAGVWAGIALSVAGIAFMQALHNTTVANTMFTLSTIPFITAALAYVFLKETLSRVTLIAMAATAAGVSLMVSDGAGSGSLYGNVMALITACAFAGFAVIVRSNRHINMLPALLVSGFLTGLVGLIASLDQPWVTLHDLLLCFLWGAVLAGIGNALFITASRHLVAAELTLFMLLEFALSPLWVWLFIGETPTQLALAGGIIVISSVAIRSLIEMGASRRLKRGRPTVT